MSGRSGISWSRRQVVIGFGPAIVFVIVILSVSYRYKVSSSLGHDAAAWSWCQSGD